MKKRILSIMLAVAMIVCMIPLGMVTVSAATTRCGITANWQSTSSLPTSSGTYYYYLTSSITLTSRYEMPSGCTLYLDLNGYTVYCNVSNNAGIYMGNSSSFYLYGTGGGTIKRNNSAAGSGVWVNNSSAYFYMYGGTITGFASSSKGGGVCVKDGYFSMNGGTITNCQAYNYGGGVYVDNGTFYMYSGSTISNNQTTNTDASASQGGGIGLTNSTSYIYGGTISNNTTYHGGGLCIQGGTTCFYGGKITGNKAKYGNNNYWGGGGIYQLSGTLTIDGGEIGPNSASNKNTWTGMQKTGGTLNLTSGRFYTGNNYQTAPSTSTKYTITLNRNGGTGGTDSLYLAWKSTLPNITVPTRTGYTFNGYTKNGEWYYNANGTPYNKTNDGTKWDYFGAQTLTAQWTANKYTVTLNNNGGTGGTTSVTATYDAAMPSATMPTKAGYTFDGYFDAQTGGTKYYNADGTSAKTWDKTSIIALYAQWTENTATLTYDANGHGTAPESVTMTYTQATNAAAAISATGYTFNGWNTKADGTGTAYAAGAQIKAANVDPAATTLYAQWTANTYTVTLDNGSVVSSTDLTATYDAVLPTVTVPVWEKHVFLGYFTAENGQGEKYVDADGTGKVTWLNDINGVTLYAYWKDSVSIDGLSLLLDGDIGLWFHVTVNDKALLKLEKGCYMEMSIGNVGEKRYTTKTVALSDVSVDASGRYLFAFDVNSIQLAEKVTATFYDADGKEYATESQSVEDYYKLIKDQSTNENEKALVKALVNYGYYAQQALSKTNGWTIGTDYATSTDYGTPTTTDLTAYKPVITGSGTHVTGLNVSLLLDNKTTLCLYFTTSDKEMPCVTIDGGSELTPIVYGETEPTITNGKVTNIEKMSDGRWLVRISNIDALHLGDVHTVTADGRTIYLSALSYGSVIGGTENINAIRALADYYQAALTYADKTVMTEATVETAEYTGEEITPAVTVMAGETTLTEAQYTVTWSGNLTDAGTYTGVITSNDESILGKLTVTVTIAPKPVEIPKAVSNLKYNGSEQTGVPAGEGYTLTGMLAATNAAQYTVTATPNANYCWVGGSTEPQKITWGIGKKTIAVPTAITGLVYDGQTQTGVPAGEGYTLNGNTATNAGNYTATATLNDTSNTWWSDGAMGEKSIQWSIAKQEIAVPTAIAGLVYNKSEQTGVPTGEGYTLNGNTATNAGEYTATATLNDTANTCWADVTTDAKSITWSIAKATPTVEGIQIDYYINGNELRWISGSRSVDGTFSFANPPTQSSDTVPVTFTPNDSTNYETVNTNAKVTVITTPVTTAVKIGG